MTRKRLGPQVHESSAAFSLYPGQVTNTTPSWKYYFAIARKDNI